MDHSRFAAQNPLIPPTITKFKIGLCQLNVTADMNQNLVHARSSIEDAVKQGARLVVLPEMWKCPYSPEYFEGNAENFEDEAASPAFSMLSEVASCHGIVVVGGSVPERDNGRLYNTCCVFAPDGNLMAKHRKIHLFDLQGDDSFKESDSFAAGDKPTVVRTDMGLIGVGICHDIRFPELAMLYRMKGAHLICYPGAFNMTTGELLWELVQRARAADNQLFVATCSPSRDSAGAYTVWGHSTLVGPSGEVIATCGCKESVVVAEIDYAAIQHQRESLALESQRRGDIYQILDC